MSGKPDQEQDGQAARKAQVDLELKVLERTEELTRANERLVNEIRTEILNITMLTIRENWKTGEGARFEIFAPYGKFKSLDTLQKHKQ